MLSSLKHILRRLVRERGFTATVLITLAFCIGANVVIFAVVDAILVRPLPFPHADRIVTTVNFYPGAGAKRPGSAPVSSVPNYYDRRENIPSFESTSIHRTGNAIVGQAGSPQRVNRDQVSPEFFATLGVPLAMGRTFTEEEMLPANSHVMILTHEYWQNQFNADSHILGQKVIVDGTSHTVVGVLPAKFRYLDSQAKFFIPLASNPEHRGVDRRHANGVQLIARLKPGVSLAIAQEQIDASNEVQLKADPYAEMIQKIGYHTTVYWLHADTVREVRPMLLLLQAGVLSLLLIGAVNIINLLLIRTHGRSKEFAVRQSLGASGWHLAKGILLETVLLTLTGGALGLYLGSGGINLLSSLGTDILPLGTMIVFDVRIALISMVLSGLLGLILAIPIAWISLRTRLSAALQSESRSGTVSRTTQRIRHGFIIAQVALAFVLLSGAGLLGLSLHQILSSSPGFESSNVLTARVSLPHSRYPSTMDRLTFFNRIQDEMRSHPGVLNVGLTNGLPFGGPGDQNVVTVEGIEPRPGASLRAHHISSTLGNYWSAMGIPLVEGRFLDISDTQSEQRVCLVDQAFAQHYWPGESALGQRLAVDVELTDGNAAMIVGVVGTVKQDDLTDTSPLGTVYRSYQTSSPHAMSIVVRSAMAPDALVPSLIKIVQTIDPELPVDDVKVMQSRINDSLVARRSPAILAGIFAITALIIAAIGTYGVLAYAVGQRRREIGVRMALGALPAQVLKLFLRMGTRILLIGITLGALGTWGVGQLMQSLLFNVAPFHPGIVVATAAVMIAVVLLATLIPSQRAAKTDPMVALRTD